MRGGRGESRNNENSENRDSRKGGVGFSGRMDKKSGFVFCFVFSLRGSGVEFRQALGGSREASRLMEMGISACDRESVNSGDGK